MTVHGSKKTRAPSPGIPQYGLFLILAADIYDTEGITIRGLKTARLLECANPLAPRLIECSTSAPPISSPETPQPAPSRSLYPTPNSRFPPAGRASPVCFSPNLPPEMTPH